MAGDVEITLDAVDGITSIFNKIGTATGDLIGKLESSFAEMPSLGAVFEGFDASAITTKVLSIIPGVGSVVGVFDMLKGVIPGLGDAFDSMFESVNETVKSWAGSLATQFTSTFSSSFTVDITGLVSTVQSLFAPVFSTITSGIAQFASTIASSQPIITSFATIIASYSTVFQVVAEAAISIITPAINVVSQTLGNLFGYAQQGIPVFESFATTVAGFVQWWAETIIGAVTLVEVIFTNLGESLSIAAMSILLSLERIRGQFAYAFTVVIPEYLTWFGDNFFNIINDTSNAVLTVASNLWDNLTGIFSGKGWTKGLLDGFEATTSALPVIADRVQSEAEKFYEGAIQESTDRMANAFSRKYNERISKLKTNIESATKKAMEPVEQIKAPEIQGPPKPEFAIPPMEEPKKGAEKDTGALSPVESRFLTRGGVENMQKQQVDLLSQIARNTQRIVDEGRYNNIPSNQTRYVGVTGGGMIP